MESNRHPVMKTLHFIGKLWVIVTAVIGSFLVVGFLFALLAILVAVKHGSSKDLSPPSLSQHVITRKGTDKIAVVDLSGTIVSDDTSSGFLSKANNISARRTIQLLDGIEKDASVKAVVLRINSPGGAVVASDEIYQRVRQLRQKKPVVVSMGDAAASGGYYIAAGANKIVANPATITGSIGVIAELPKLSGLFSKIGVEMRVIKSGDFKDIGSPNRDLTPEEKAIFQTMISEAYDQFIHSIVSGRNMDEAKVRQLADGRIYTGLQAQKNGLVDELGNFNQAVSDAEALAQVSNASVVEYSDQNFWGTLLESKMGSISPFSSIENVLPQEKFGLYYLMQF